ncbi:MAG: methyltransferase [Bacteroidia bacterium]
MKGFTEIQEAHREQRKIKTIKKAIVILLGTAGIILPNMTYGRWLAILSSCFPVYFLFQYPSLKRGITYLVLSMILHYTVLFGTFVKGGFKEFWLKTSPTKEEAHRKFEAWLSFAFFHNGLAFSYLYFTTMNQQDFAFTSTFWLMGFGIVLQVTGFIIKFLASFQIGLAIYYYKDMFIEEKVTDFVSKGIFKYMSNPLYGWGQMNGYGAALYTFSWYGIVAVLINQLCFYCFYYSLEKPFVQRFYFVKWKVA